VTDGRDNARRLLAWMRANPQAHRQLRWFTVDGLESDGQVLPPVLHPRDESRVTMCAATAMVHLDGWSVRYDEGAVVASKDGEEREVQVLAADLLGIGAGLGDALFQLADDGQALRMVAALADGVDPDEVFAD
jgi:hypothetical protein